MTWIMSWNVQKLPNSAETRHKIGSEMWKSCQILLKHRAKMWKSYQIPHLTAISADFFRQIVRSVVHRNVIERATRKKDKTRQVKIRFQTAAARERIIVPLDRRTGHLKFTYPGQYQRRGRLPQHPLLHQRSGLMSRCRRGLPHIAEYNATQNRWPLF